MYVRHTNTGNGSTVGTVTFSTAMSTITVLNRSTNDIYWTSTLSQGTAGDGVPTVQGNNCWVTPGVVGQSTTVPYGQNAGTVSVSYICTVTNSPFSLIVQ